MKKKRAFVLALTVLLPLAICLAFLPIYPFAGVLHDGTGQHVLIPVELKSDDLAAVAEILDRYDETYWMTETSIRVPLQLFLDEEMRWNYTGKAGISR